MKGSHPSHAMSRVRGLNAMRRKERRERFQVRSTQQAENGSTRREAAARGNREGRAGNGAGRADGGTRALCVQGGLCEQGVTQRKGSAFAWVQRSKKGVHAAGCGRTRVAPARNREAEAGGLLAYVARGMARASMERERRKRGVQTLEGGVGTRKQRVWTHGRRGKARTRWGRVNASICLPEKSRAVHLGRRTRG